MIPKNFKSSMQTDCDKLFKKFQKVANQLNAMNENLSLEYLETLPPKERNMIIEKAIKLQMEFIPMINLKEVSYKYLDYIDTHLKKLYGEKETGGTM